MPLIKAKGLNGQLSDLYVDTGKFLVSGLREYYVDLDSYGTRYKVQYSGTLQHVLRYGIKHLKFGISGSYGSSELEFNARND
jgi:hypothetical protein